jgi:hypothetical protein
MVGLPRPVGRRTAVFVAAFGILLACSGCAGGSVGTSSSDAARDGKAVLRADLTPGSTGQTAADLSQRFIHMPGVWGARGDAGAHVWVYTDKNGAESQIAGIRGQLASDPAVASVQRER